MLTNTSALHISRLMIAASIAPTVLLAGCSSGPTVPPKSRLEVMKGKIDPDAVIEMDRDGYRKTFSKLGKKQFDEANALMSWAAMAAAESNKCDRVEVVALSDKATRKQLQYFVDCANKERFQITQAHAKAMQVRFDPKASAEEKEFAQKFDVATPKSDRWKGFDEANAATACDLTVQNAMLVPSSFSAGFNRWDIEKNDDTGLVTIQRDYNAENAYSMKINSRYECVIDTSKKQIVRLKIREPNGWRKLI